jgi:hypothetical protein
MPIQMELENLLFSYLGILKLDSSLRSDVFISILSIFHSTVEQLFQNEMYVMN